MTACDASRQLFETVPSRYDSGTFPRSSRYAAVCELGNGTPCYNQPMSSGKETLKEFVERLEAEQRAKGLKADLRSPSSATPAYSPPPDLALAGLVHHPAVVLILGHRGMGKTALACRLQEILRDRAPAYAIGLPPKARRILPGWYGLADDPADVPTNAVIYVPESYRMFHARATQTAQGRAIGDLVNLSRHRRHTLIFDVQNPAHLDRNIISEADIVLVKEPGPFTPGFERAQLRPVMNAARAAFAGVNTFRRKRAVWVVAPAAGIEGQLMENQLPIFWTDSLSRIFGDATPTTATRGVRPSHTERANAAGRRTTAAPRRGQKTPSEDKKARAKRLRASGYSYNEIGRMLGVGKSQAYRLVNGA